MNTNSPSYRATLTTYLLPLKGKVVVLALTLLGSISLQLVIPLLLARFIDNFPAGEAAAGLVAIGIAYLVAGLVNQLFSAWSTYLGADIGWTATNRLRFDLTKHMLNLDMGFHNEHTPGEMIERIDGDVTAVADFLSRFTVRLLGSAILLVGVIAVSWFTNWWIGLSITAYVMTVLFILARMRNLAVSASEKERETSAQLYGFIEERLAGIDDIRANGAGEFTMRRFIGVMRDFFVRTTSAWRKRTILWVTANTCFWSGEAIALTVGVWLNLSGTITVGTAYLILQYIILVRTPIEQVAQEFQELQKAAGGIIRIDQMRRLTTALVDNGTKQLPSAPLEIAFRGVSFAYEQSQILEDISFILPAGERLGLLGRTGGGKTTITRLVSRLYDAGNGQVRVGGEDVRDLSLESLRMKVGVVSQDVHLFQASVRNNLTIFRTDLTDGQLLTKLRRAGLADWVLSLGLDTELGVGGEGLSAGQQQLLAFARVFLQDPGVVILDEPSSRLDPATDQQVSQAAERLFEGRTVMVIAHRLETVRKLDRIMVVDDGRIVEYDRREVLENQPDSHYRRLLAASEVVAG